MNIEQQVCSLEQAKRLCEFEIGIDYEPVFAWVPPFPVFNDSLKLITVNEFKHHLINSILSDETKGIVNYYPAFTVAELGVMLPEEIQSGKWEEGFGLTIKSPVCFKIDDLANYKWIKYDTEAQARAEILIYLLENNLIAADEVNKNLAK